MRKRQSLTMIISAAALGLFSAASSVHAAPSEVIYSGDPNSNEVALTFDDPADGVNVPSILQILDDYNVPATFFITSYGDSNQVSYMQDIVAQGHQIANHSYDHPYFTEISDYQMRNQLESNEEFIQNATGINPQPYFRPPYGDYDTGVLETAGDLGYTNTIMWSVDTRDWTGNSSEEIVQRVMDDITPGGIILMHTRARATGTPEALPEIITNLDNMGYEFVTIDEMLDADVDPGNSGSTQYTIQPGDTLSAIAGQYGTTVDALASANNISDPNFIIAGQTLTIPGTGGNGGNGSTPDSPDDSDGTESTTYTVQAGDTLSAIASEFGTTVDAIASANNISDVNFIVTGQTLTIPGTGGNGGSDDGNGSTPDSPDESDGTESTTYTVQAGDTLSAIASEFGTTVDAIASANNISDVNFIVTGQTLTIPGTDGNGGNGSAPDGSNGSGETGTETYTVEAGDTLWAIANEYGTTVDAIASENNISNPDFISVGQVIAIP